MKTLSIIVPTYNVEDYLGKCLDSTIIEGGDIEVIVVIDGSKDRSCEIAKSFQDRYPNIITVIEKENGHYGSCVNVGISHARGKYVKILDADDSFGPVFEKYVSFLRDEDADVILTDYVSVDDKDSILYTSRFTFINGKTKGRVEDLADEGFRLMYHYELTYRTNLLKTMSYRQTEGVLYSDLEWSTIPFSIIKTYSYCPLIVYRYLKGRRGQSIDIKIRKDFMWMENKVVLGIVDLYEAKKNEIAPANEYLLRSFSKDLVRIVYQHYLINYRKLLKETELISFDKDLKQASETIYQSVTNEFDRRKFGRFYYIRDFRNKKPGYYLKYTYYDFCRLVGSIVRR